MLKAIIKYLAKRTHDVKMQLLLSALYGMLSLYGFGGMVSILVKTRKMANSQKSKKRVTV